MLQNCNNSFLGILVDVDNPRLAMSNTKPTTRKKKALPTITVDEALNSIADTLENLTDTDGEIIQAIDLLRSHLDYWRVATLVVGVIATINFVWMCLK